MSQKYEAPQGPPPGYPSQPQPVYQDAGAVDPRGFNNQYSSPPPQGQWGPPQQGGYYQQGPPMGYQAQPQYPGQPPAGYYQQGPPPGGRGSDGAGCCAGIMAALACCCCVDFLF